MSAIQLSIPGTACTRNRRLTRTLFPSVEQRGAGRSPRLRCAKFTNHNIVITGSTKGIGRALAEEFLKAGDNVIICSRTASRVSETVKALQSVSGSSIVKGIAVNVAKPADVAALAEFAQAELGTVDAWINNAGSNAYSYKPLTENQVQDLISIVQTNVLGVMLCCREAIKLMADQPQGGRVFLMDGAGADGGATPQFAAYGSTKRGLAQFQKSLTAELKLQKLDNRVRVDNLSPGMVTTDLLMSGSTSSSTAAFFINALAETPETVAEYLVPRIRQVLEEGKPQDSYIRFLTKPKAYSQIIQRLITGARKGRFVPEE